MAYETKTIYDNFLKYFSIEEIVSPELFQKFQHKGNYFFLSRFDIRLLSTMIIVRESLDKSITINNWKWGGPFDERGFRDTSTPMVQTKSKSDIPWFSGHVVTMALDFDVKGMTANQVRKWIKDNQDLFPFKIRLERKLNGKFISWVHLDIIDEPKNPWIYEFDV